MCVLVKDTARQKQKTAMQDSQTKAHCKYFPLVYSMNNSQTLQTRNCQLELQQHGTSACDVVKEMYRKYGLLQMSMWHEYLSRFILACVEGDNDAKFATFAIVTD